MTAKVGSAGSSMKKTLNLSHSRQTWVNGLRRLLQAARRCPTTVVLSATMVLVSLVGFIVPRSEWGWDFLDGGENEILRQHHWWGALSSLLAVSDVAGLCLTVLVLAISVGAVERVMGSWRTLLAYLGGGVLASFGGSVIGWLEETYFSALPLNAPSRDVLSPWASILCTVVAGSAFMGTLWRRRVRLLATVLAVMFYLYSGAANDLFSLVAIPIGLGLGFLLGGSHPGTRLIHSSHHEMRVLVAAAVGISAIGPVVATMFGAGRGLLSPYGWFGTDQVYVIAGQPCAFGSSVACPLPADGIIDDDFVHQLVQMMPAAGLVGLIPVALALVTAWGLFRGRREALWIALIGNLAMFVYLAPFALSEALSLGDTIAVNSRSETPYIWQDFVAIMVSAVLPLANTIIFMASRRHFRVATPRRLFRRYITAVCGTALATLVATVAGQIIWKDQFTPTPSILDILVSSPLRLLPPGFQHPELYTFVPRGFMAEIFWYLPSVVFWSAALWITIRLMAVRPAISGQEERRRARVLLERGGGDTLSFMTTWAGNRYWFAPDADAAVAYRLESNTAVTLGGPFGPDYGRPDIIESFVRYCGDHGWTPLFYNVDDRIRLILEERGWSSLHVAEEALLQPAEWAPTGKKRQDIRTATNRAARENLAAVWTSWAELNIFHRNQLTALSEEWVTEKELPEMGFTLGGLDELTDPAVRLMVAIDENDRVQAVTSWLPHYGADGVDGYTLDFMRRGPEAMPGIIEFVIGAAAEQMKTDGMTVMSLSGAPLARLGTPDGESGRIARLLDLLGQSLEPAYGFRSLLAFKRKFQPVFEPRWLLYPDATKLPAAGIAILRSYMPQLTLRGAARLARQLGATERTPR
ncbi:Lysylphosphatidylglycerol synthetase, C-terminal domain, DUF2156 family [Agreia bicolorata]|uniref:Lysylphosphatidylglycerol synthetase, C-terminal domain, DUF2156 family n=1 Tax=Agreia bicolorata TaxID=110935 RepID=A0A1T4WRD8_9MICO|nr:DUF2156 domain-containing protein [Agreia bicolorata]SKA79930.1 Lysylphosphatidylglycerol synthetase, C-terminal domain, DUF2156 family [Agreia bicolorata]